MDWIINILQEIWEGLIAPIFYFANPEKRINYLYLASSLLLAYYVFIRAKENGPFYKFIFHKKVWFSKSAFVDYKYFFFNGIIKLLLILPIYHYWKSFSVDVNDFLEESFSISTIHLSQNEVLIYYALSLAIIGDLVFYCVHWLMHHIPFLWEFHKIHHSATSLNPITQYRLHPVELIINNFTFILVSAVLAGVFDYFHLGVIAMTTAAEANIFALFFLFFGVNLRHSHVKLKYFNFLERIFISPFQHQIHHSDNPKHFNKNMGSKLAIWDWAFGSLLRSKSTKKLSFGLGYKENDNYKSFFKSLYTPFINIVKLPFKKRRPNTVQIENAESLDV